MQAKLPSKSAWTREAKRKEDQRVSSHLESTDCSSEDEKVYFRSRFTRSQHQPLRKKEDSQSSADLLSDNSMSKIVQDTIKTSTSIINKKNSSQIQTSHLIMQQHRVVVKDRVEIITNSVKVRITLNEKGKLTIS